MRILLLTHSFNSLTQRLYAELREDGHELSVEFDINDAVAEEAVALFAPDLVLAPFLKRAVPEAIWRAHPTLIVHPGIVGDRGPSALDWAIMGGATEWGVTVLQAEAQMDAGPIWATRAFALREATKASLYRSEVTDAALAAVREAIGRLADWRAGTWRPTALADWPEARGQWRELMRQADRRIDWAADDTATVLRKIRAADGFPGVADALFGAPCHLFDARPAPGLGGAPGELIGRCDGAVLRATVDGAVWIGHVKRADSDPPFKLPATVAFEAEAATLPAIEADADIGYRESDDGQVGFLRFDFYNGAMSTDQCRRLQAAIETAGRRPTRVLVLEGGADFWSNGIHLNRIEAAASPADASWANINAMDDVCLALLSLTDKLTVAALRGNAGAGGCFLALAADRVWAREGVVLNPHYKNMGNLFGSEYWTYLLPRRVGEARAQAIMADRLPLLARAAQRIGLIDACFGDTADAFVAGVSRRAGALASDADFAARLADKRTARERDEAQRPLAAYREDELAHMQRNFFGFDPSYHVARYHFVAKTPQSWTPRHLARHRDIGWRVPEPAGEAR
ncbi:hydrogenase maturation protein [Nitrogeniibacter mangrovi]|uniref:Hydrogenase maturation protein n=1 Tax=Nitrogeniibacter mangrovi TaxID=2016596 RepID=A0A6C1B1K9_9RHOO|nr:hydrogenase maturation protein [Nitrogeniibacter mangrovi]QID16869.1 hydrogenase maturation protein [Nitrogeniibacter mangrovi]